MTEGSNLKEAIRRCQEVAKASGIEYGDRKYLQVKDRLEIFRMEFGLSYGIDTEIKIDQVGSETVIGAKAQIRDMNGRVVAAGHAMIFYGRDEISRNSPVEAVETWAIGRALAAFGLFGNEYASANEMDRVQSPQKKSPPKADAFAKDLESKYLGNGGAPRMTEKEREFRKALEEVFPPKIGGSDYFIPADNSPESMGRIYEEIDRIDTAKGLHAYYTMLEESMQWMKPEDVEEIKRSFKDRRKQIQEG